MQKEDFAALWKTIHLKVTDTLRSAARNTLGERLYHWHAG